MNKVEMGGQRVGMKAGLGIGKDFPNHFDSDSQSDLIQYQLG